ncbi:Zn-dependent exopeptidase [Suillus paluster]|uniref:Zn-dependent exopeptidase n=1 Tax=Suillus paluster TaxID=48578 RepID=UPI001B85CCC5|nr:Zn-dependent exopeptidase [Suillus paluster]KAG1727082.1 Zn-dependent exopeptidase [Suillus paluster]
MNAEKSEKAVFYQPVNELLPHPPGLVQARRHPRRPFFRKLLVHASFSLTLFLLYKALSTSCFVDLKKDWQAYHDKKSSESYDSYIKRIEDGYLAVPSAESALAASRDYATHPHLAGAVEDFQDAKDILALFQSEFGIPAPATEPIYPAGSPESREATLSSISKLSKPAAWVDIYYPVMNTGNADGLAVELLGESDQPIWKANLLEDGDPRDETAAKYKDAIPPWHGLSAGGEAIGQLVYANYGTKDDYDKLVGAGVDLTGKIVLTRYGANFRGLKVQGAAERGALGVLIYSDPRDDGSVTVENGYEPYPAGPARNPSSVQRGSVMYLSIYPGDPTTPGYPAYENATRIEATNIPTIPSLPLSWANAKLLFEEELGGVLEGTKLNGRVGSRKVRMVNDVDTKVTPIWNTMAAIPGHIKDEVVLLGCHRDAWVMGAADPTSGTVSLREVVRGLGALYKRGWKPLRTIVIASWDAEEYGLIGSTEWGEDFAEWIQAHVVSYVNVDVSVGGSRWDAGASPSLTHLIQRSAQDVPHPTDAQKTLWDARFDVGPYNGPVDAGFARMWDEKTSNAPHIDPLGSGSDYTVFLQRLGVASSDQGFGMTPTDAPYHYHSIYDSQMWQEVYADPGFHKHVAVAQNLGLMTLRLTDSIILPLNTTQYALELDSYVDIVIQSAYRGDILPDLYPLRKAIAKLQDASFKLDEEKASAETAFRKALKNIDRARDPRVVRRIIQWIKEHLGIGALQVQDLRFGALKWMSSVTESSLSGPDICRSRSKGPLCDFVRAAKRVRVANQKLAAFERGFISEDGIKDREWFKHLGVAPGKHTGYAPTTLPGLTEAILIEEDLDLAEYEAARLTTLIENLADFLEV